VAALFAARDMPPLLRSFGGLSRSTDQIAFGRLEFGNFVINIDLLALLQVSVRDLMEDQNAILRLAQYWHSLKPAGISARFFSANTYDPAESWSFRNTRA
jgi:hypothetical protein